MEDLLAHAVDNMRIKNVNKTQLARRAEQPKPSLLVSIFMIQLALTRGFQVCMTRLLMPLYLSAVWSGH